MIKKHTSLLNFRELGFDIRAQLLLKVEKTEELKTFLEKHQSVNNIFRINNGFDFLIEAIFENMSSFDKFFKDISTYNLKKSKEYFILEDIKREGFMEFNPILHANY
ncbi:MAG: Lrp/AsnC ligand binding domain-containing protein [Candidatus Woesearchaeota archaeon]